MKKNLLTTILMLAVAAPAFAGSYRVQELKLAEGASVSPHAVNAHGAVAGGVGQAHGGDIAMFTGAGPEAVAAIGRGPASDYTEAMAINDQGQVAGSMNGANALTAFVWDRARGMRTLAPLAGDTGSAAAGINSAGWVVGTSMGPQGIRAVVWRSGTAELLGAVPNATTSSAIGINAGGQVAGWAEIAGVKHAVLWSAAGEAQDLGTFAGENTEAVAINAQGEIAGLAEKNGEPRAFRWSAGHGFQELGTLAGGSHSQASGINGAGQVVGSSGSKFGLRAFVWTGSAMVDLNTLIPNDANLVLMSAVAINDKGQILALGSRNHDLANDRATKLDQHAHAGATRAFLLTPQ